MFDFSLPELGVVALVALLVLGPQRLPKAARTLGLYLRRARASWYAVKADIERELAADELKRSLKAGQEVIQRTGESIRREVEALHPASAEDAHPIGEPTASDSDDATNNTGAAPGSDTQSPERSP